MSQQTLLVITFFSLFLAIVGLIFGITAFLKTNKTQKNLALLFSGKDAKDLESIIMAQIKEITEMDKEIQDLFEISNKIHALAQKSIHKVGIVRFNPFKDIGGDQSFAIALLDGKNSGLTVSSLHTREGTRMYSKPIDKGVSEKYTLTEEEKQAIKEATIIKPTTI